MAEREEWEYAQKWLAMFQQQAAEINGPLEEMLELAWEGCAARMDALEAALAEIPW